MYVNQTISFRWFGLHMNDSVLAFHPTCAKHYSKSRSFVPCIKCNIFSFTKHHVSSTVLHCWTCMKMPRSWYPTLSHINLHSVELDNTQQNESYGSRHVTLINQYKGMKDTVFSLHKQWTAGYLHQIPQLAQTVVAAMVVHEL